MSTFYFMCLDAGREFFLFAVHCTYEAAFDRLRELRIGNAEKQFRFIEIPDGPVRSPQYVMDV